MTESWTVSRILVVEDEPSLRVVLEDLLKGNGYLAESVDSGRDAKHQINHKDFDLVIMDVILPDTDGFEVCKYVRQQGVSAPVLMLRAMRHLIRFAVSASARMIT